MLTVSSLLTILLFTLHVADDIVRGFEKGQLSNLGTLPIAVVWLYGTLVLGERRSGHVIMLVLGILALGIPYIHMRGRGIGVHGAIGSTSGALLFVWTLIAMGVTALLAVVLATRALWLLRRGQPGGREA